MITKVMGVILFVLGAGGILLGTAGFLNQVPQLTGIEQTVLMFGGAILCLLGYFMARPKPEEPPLE